MSLECLLIADDLTGACDAAAPFARRGWRTVVPVADGEDADVLAVSTDSRDMPVDLAERMGGLAPLASRARVVFKKIDSTLRGDPGGEIAAAMTAFGFERAVVCPAFPAMGRIVRGGQLSIVGDQGFAPVDVRALLGGFECFDADCDAHLDCIAATEGRVLWAGSAGLAAALARRLGVRGEPAPRPAVRGQVLFCVGSDHPVTLHQLERLGTNEQVVRIPWGKCDMRQLTGIVPGAVILSGGATASLVCRAMGVQAIELCEEVMAGIPRGILRGGAWDGTPVVTKSGAFGDQDALVRIAEYFHG